MNNVKIKKIKKFIESLTHKEIKVIEGRMRPGQFSSAGFLGKNESLKDVIEADSLILNRYGITHNQIGDRLDYLAGRALREWELAYRRGKVIKDGVIVDGIFRIFSSSFIGYWAGYQVCPFFYRRAHVLNAPCSIDYTCGIASTDLYVKNERTNVRIHFSELMGHLVRDHHFFEGKTRYRLDPEKAIKVLELKQGIDYAPKKETEFVWRFSDAISYGRVEPSWSITKKIVRDGEKKFDSDGIKIYTIKNEGIILADEDIKFKNSLKINGEDVILFGNFIRCGQYMILRVENNYVI